MSFNYSYKNFGDLLNKKHTIVFPKKIGILKSDFININDDIVLCRNYFDIYKNTSITYNFDLKGLTINIALEAEFLFQSELSEFSCLQKSNNTKICIINKEKGNVNYKANSKLKNLLIFIKEDFFIKLQKDNNKFEKLLENINNTKLSLAIKSTTTNVKTKLCAYEIYNASNETSLDNIFIQSKVLELLSYEFNELMDERKIQTSKINYSQYDIKALHEAKNILIKNMKNPPSIIQLSKKVKLNEFKLKYGFKKLFNTTPYDFLREHKLHEAKELLAKGDMNISEIAMEVGYKQTHGFTNAFYKRFGVKPKELMRSRKYHY